MTSKPGSPQWTSDQLDKVGTAEELQIASIRRDGTLRKPVTVWVARDGDDPMPESPCLHSRLDGASHLAGERDAHHRACRREVANPVPCELERFDALRVNAGVSQKSERGSRACER